MIARDKQSNLLDLFSIKEEQEVLSIQPLWPYSEHFIFFVTYEWDQKARLFSTIKPSANST